MQGEKGICVVGDNSNPIRSTKFNTKENCAIGLSRLLGLEVVPKNYVVYKCKECGFFHFGKPEWREKYGYGN